MKGTKLTLTFDVRENGSVSKGILNWGNGDLDPKGVKYMISLLPFAMGQVYQEVLEQTSKSVEEDKAIAIHNFGVGIMLKDDEEVHIEHKEPEC